MEFFEVRFRCDKMPVIGETGSVICTSYSKAMEIAKEWSKIFLAVWICRMNDNDGVLEYSNKSFITIK